MCRIVPTEYLPPPPATRGEGGEGGDDQENCVEKELGGNTEIYLQVNTVAHPSYSYCTNTHCVLCTLHKRNKQNKPICISSITK